MSKDFHYSNDIAAIHHDETPLVNSDTQPWHTSGEEDELGIYFKQIKSYNTSNIFQPLNGFQVFIHNPDEFVTHSSFYIFEKYEDLKMFKITPEIALIADELKSWSIQERNCYLPDEKKLEFFRIYTKINCEQECLSMTAYEACKCVPFYLIRKSIDKLLF